LCLIGAHKVLHALGLRLARSLRYTQRMKLTLRAIQTALRATGTTIAISGAGCGGDGDPAATDGGGRPQGDAGKVLTDAGKLPGDAAADDDSSVSWLALSPFPLSALRCGASYDDYDDAGVLVPGGYFGSCCVRALCYSPDAGGGCDPVSTVDEHFGLGSGDCGCEGEREGPFAPNPDATPPMTGECCYAVPVVGCTGRPLASDAGHLVASVVSRLAWIA
jgi:hypothetical protein